MLDGEIKFTRSQTVTLKMLNVFMNFYFLKFKKSTSWFSILITLEKRKLILNFKKTIIMLK